MHGGERSGDSRNSALQAIRLLFSAQPSAIIGAVITEGASFNLQAVKEELDRKMASQAAQ
jgi:hypothetical protein